MTKLNILLMLACLTPLFAADPTGAVLWKTTALNGMEKTLATKMDETKSGTGPLLNGSGYLAIFFHREANGQAEVHEKLADFVVVHSGEGAILVGGTVVGGKPSAPGEVRGTSIAGGTLYPVAAGDVLYIPANVPHQMQVKPGKQLNAMVIKVEPK
jgi:mannose-6-phosphate isomerase-like protein (cupin superfamily)